MPFVSEAQRRKFYATPSLHKYIAEFNAATPKGVRLPRRKKMASRFDKMAAELSKRPGVTNPRGLAATFGRRKYGSSTMARAAAQGVSAASIRRKRS